MTPDPEQLAEQHAREFAGPQDRMLRQAGRALEAAVQHLPEAEQIAFADRYMARLTQLALAQSSSARPGEAATRQSPEAVGLLGDADPRTRRSGFRLWVPVLLVALVVILVLVVNGLGAR
ncbi:hypothetical protein [Pseudoxanthomonas sp. X-1]|uniref:hypothetical protein n=1 Tax=Pseudoxanthomonas sp. X-1 TaxID=2571115 RepID=UPI00110AAB68|nr:hypothetical protein [Pseudoxanthomonas sp. X-1]TMN25126.1 hypothetical protein FF950_03095 [Pseudoxanthomonas sp. X-1]UAY74859.1 hypothetical protein LAJ50_00850 [Pseudoxanthomonas sp. X-1]